MSRTLCCLVAWFGLTACVSRLELGAHQPSASGPSGASLAPTPQVDIVEVGGVSTANPPQQLLAQGNPIWWLSADGVFELDLSASPVALIQRGVGQDATLGPQALAFEGAGGGLFVGASGGLFACDATLGLCSEIDKAEEFLGPDAFEPQQSILAFVPCGSATCVLSATGIGQLAAQTAGFGVASWFDLGSSSALVGVSLSRQRLWLAQAPWLCRPNAWPDQSPASIRCVDEPGLVGSRVTADAEFVDGPAYGTEASGVVWLRPSGVVDLAALLPSPHVTALAVWNGALWIGTDAGLLALDAQGQLSQRVVLSGESGRPIHALLVRPEGLLVAAATPVVLFSLTAR